MKLPEILHKYDKFIESISDKTNIDNYAILSNYLVNQILDSKDGDLILKMRTGVNKYDFYKPELDDVPNCFVSRVWRYSTFEDKIKIVDKYLDYLFQNNIEHKPSLRIIANPLTNEDQFCGANYNRQKNEIYLNLDNLNVSDGLSIMSIVYHEVVHAFDFENIKNFTIPEILTKYTNKNGKSYIDSSSVEKEIIDLPIDGYLIDKTNGQKVLVQGDTQRKILKCKNFYEIFNEPSIYDPRAITSKEDFEEYVNSMLYWYSPIERTARVGVRNFFRTQLNDNRLPIVDDIMSAERIVHEEVNVDKFLNDFKQLLIRPCGGNSQETIIDMKDFYNLASQHKFYCERRGDWGIPNAQTYPDEAQETKEKFNKVMGEIYSNLLFKMQYGLLDNHQDNVAHIAEMESC